MAKHNAKNPSGWRRAWGSLWWRRPVSLDLRSIAAFRVGLGLLALADIVQRAQDLQAHYTDWGLLPRGVLIQQHMFYAVTCIHLMSGTAAGIAILFVLHGLAAGALIVGWRSRTMAFVLWFLTYGLHLRNPMVLQGGDDLLRMLFFWGMFLPLGARFSVDAGLHQDAGTCSIVPGLQSAPQSNNRLLNVATVALVGQLVLLYACTALFKTGAAWHQEASAVYYALNYDQLAKPFGIWLRQFAWLLPPLTHVTFWTEAAAPFLLLMPWAFGPVRALTCILLMLMHHAFAACLILGLFPWIDMVSLIALLPSWFWSQLSRRCDWQQQKLVTIFYDDDCTFCKKMVQVLRQFLLLPDVSVLPAQSDPAANALMLQEDSWVVRQGNNDVTMWRAFVVLAAVSPVLRPVVAVLRWPRVDALGQGMYRGVARRRGWLSHMSRRYCPWAPVAQATAWPVSALAGVAFALVLAWNVQTLNGPKLAVPEPLRTWALALRLDQRWNMFSPFPATDDGWFVVSGRLDDGTPWDVWNNGAGPVSFDKPAVVSASLPNQRWSKYMMNLWQAANATHRLYFGQYLCRKYNGATPRHPKALGQFEIFYVREDTLPNGTTRAPERISLWRHTCWEPLKEADLGRGGRGVIQ